MSDRAPASITIGGTLPLILLSSLVAAIEIDNGRADWEGEPVEEGAIESGQILEVFATELRGGIFEDIECFCLQHKLPFVRSSASCVGVFGPERAVYTGDGAPSYFELNENDEVVLTRAELSNLGGFDAAGAYFDAAEFTPPPLTIVAEGETGTALLDA